MVATKIIFSQKSHFIVGKNYGKALRDTKKRLKDHLFTRSLDEFELKDMKAPSQNQMKKTFNWFG